MSALSLGTVVVEAHAKSGSLITVDHALSQGRDVFVVPGDVMSPAYAGNIRMLQDGAMPVYTPADVLLEYTGLYPHKLDLKNAGTPIGEDELYARNFRFDVPESKSSPKSKREPKTKEIAAEPETKFKRSGQAKPVKSDEPFVLPPLSSDVSEVSIKIYNCFTKRQMSLDILISESGLSPREALSCMTELEIMGIISSMPGNQYEIN